MPSWRIPWATKEFEPVKVSEIETGGGGGGREGRRGEGGESQASSSPLPPQHLGG